MLQTRDAGFLPEEEMWARLGDSTPYELRMSPVQYPLQRLLRIASRVGAEQPGNLVKAMSDTEPGVRYWAAMAAGAQSEVDEATRQQLVRLLQDAHPAVRIEAAYALARLGDRRQAIPVLVDCLANEDVNAVLHAARALELLNPDDPRVVAAMRQARQRAAGDGTIEMFVRFAADAYLQPGGQTATQ